MPYFNESQLELSIITLLQEQGYEYVKGEDIVRILDEVVLVVSRCTHPDVDTRIPGERLDHVLQELDVAFDIEFS